APQFKMLTVRHMLTCVQQQDWFAAIDLKDAYFHVSILPRHGPFLRFAYEGRAYQYKVLPFGLSLSPHVFTKIVEAALAPLREQGIHILNYLDDWLILAQSQELVCEHRDQVLRVNWEKSKLSPVQSISFLVAPFIRPHSVNAELFKLLQAQDSGPIETISEAPGAFCIHSHGHGIQTPSHETTLALASRLSPEIGMAPWHTSSGYHTDLSPSVQPLVGPCVATGGSARHVVVTTDASETGWGAVCNRHAVSGSWTGPRLQWHINCLELLTVLLALRRLWPLIQDKHVLVRMDNTATVAYINRQGGLTSRRMSELARHLLLWSLQHVKSLRAVHILGRLNHAADVFSQQEWRLHPQTVLLIWNRFGE
ncbi:hypothetical protein M9458_011586, partial [Cirrhinus mrigala]